ncbi:MAG: restriction endonuclease subunit S [Clostridium sp.]|uniref:restriction endonuclease subunit S n=1 Tax=Clostridium sp. TaxID=1506 RepID=UPI003D6D529F
MKYSKFEKRKLGEILNFRRGHDLCKKDMIHGIYPVVGSNGVIGYHNKFTTDAPCLTIGRSGNIGTPHFLNQKCWAHNTTLYVDDFKGNNPEYIYYLLKTLDLAHYGGGSAVPTLNRNHIHPVDVIFTTNTKVQIKIARILSTIDKKIEMNNSINENLQSISQLLFKRWFVDFEFENEEGLHYKSSGGDMVDSELGMIPKGWKIDTIFNIAEVIGGGTPPTKNEEYYTDNEIAWITPKDLSGYTFKFISRGNRDITESGFKNSSAKLIPKGTVLFSSRAPIGYIAIAKNEACTNQGFKSLVPKEGFGTEFIYNILISNKDKIEGLANGSTFKEVSGQTIKEFKITVPIKPILDRFEELAKDLSKKILNNEEEIITLTNLRDTLLPKLMNGEIDLDNLEINL